MSGRLKCLWVIIPLFLLLASLPVLTACGGETKEEEVTPVQEEVLKFGISLDFTSYYASAQRIAAEGILDHFWYINQNGGIDGVRIEPLWADDAARADKTLSIWNDFVEKGVTQFCIGTTEGLTIVKDRAEKIGMAIPTGSVAAASLFPQTTIVGLDTPYAADCAAFVDWYCDEVWDKWSEGPPNFAFVTSDTGGGRGILTDELIEYIEKVKKVPIVDTVLLPPARRPLPA